MKKKKILAISITVLLAAFLIIPLLFADFDRNFLLENRSISAPIFYGITFIISAGILVYYVLRNKRKYFWVLLLFVAVIVVNAGYLSLSLASNLSEALLANRIAYFGNVYMLLFLFLTIVNACGINCSRLTVITLFAISSIMFIFSSTQGFLDLFYKNVDFAIVNGYAVIQKDYGPMHTVYMIYILIYFMMIVYSLFYSWKKKKNRDIKYIAVLAGMGFINVALWLAEQFLDNNIEFLALSYILNEIVLLWVYNRLVESGVLNTYLVKLTFRPEDYPEKTVDIILSDLDENKILISHEEHPINFSQLPEEKLLEIINQIHISDRLTDREKEVTVLLLKNLKRKEIAKSLFISEDTVKTHTSHIYGKLEVSSKEELQELASDCMEKRISE